MKKILIAIGILMVGGLIWYFFLKSYGYLVTFKAKTFPGAIQQTIQLWNNDLDSAEITDKKGITELTQQLKFGDSVHIYEWQILPINDSLSKIKVYASDRDHSLSNKIAIPFLDTDFEKRTRKTVLDLGKNLKEHVDNFKVTIVGREQLKSRYCACTTLKTSQFGKAKGMMKDFPLLDNVLVSNDLKPSGLPLIEVTKWDRENDLIQFNFCYPIVRPKIIPDHLGLSFKKLRAKSAIKAVYNGNYTTSDRAWYALLNYAEKNNLEVTGLPIEIFYNNPNMGGDALRWKAEIYMPLKITDE